MIETVDETSCRTCGRPIVQAPGGHRLRIYCNAACKMRDRRRKSAEHTSASTVQEVESARDQIVALQTENAALQRRVQALEKLLDEVREIEEAFLTDTRPYGFKHWLRTRGLTYAQTAFGKRFLERSLGMSPRGSRGTYQDELIRAGFTKEEQETCWQAWRAMLSDERFTSYYAANRNQS